MTPNPQDSAVALEVERAAFEAHLRAVWKVPESYLDWALTIRDGSYLDSRAQDQWGGWQARASQSDGTSGGWQPIETAPKDGTLIVLGAHNGVWLGKYVPVYGSGYRPENPWSSMLLNHDHMAERYTRPTHWMPLPSAPNQGESHVG